MNTIEKNKILEKQREKMKKWNDSRKQAESEFLNNFYKLKETFKNQFKNIAKQ